MAGIFKRENKEKVIINVIKYWSKWDNIITITNKK